MTVKDLKKDSTSYKETQEELKRLMMAAINYYQKGEFQSAFIYTKRLQRLAHEMNDALTEGQALSMDGNMHFSMGNNEKALEISKQIIKQFPDIPYIQVSGYNCIGMINLKEGNINDGLKNFKKAYKNTENVDNKEIHRIRILSNIAIIYRIKGDFKNSLANVKQNLELSKLNEDHFGSTISYGNAGRLYMDFLNYKDAIINFESCIFYAKKIDAKMYILEPQIQICESLIMLGEYEQAEVEMRKMEKVSQSLKITQLIPAIKTTTALWMYKAKGDHNGALSLVKEVNQLIQSSEKSFFFEHLVKNLAVKIMIELDLDMFQEALVDIEEAFEIIEKTNALVQSIIFLNLKGLFKSAEFQFDEAQNLLQKAIKLATDYGIKNHLEKTQSNLDLIQNLERANNAYDVAISEQQKQDKMNKDKMDLFSFIKEYVEYALPKIH